MNSIYQSDELVGFYTIKSIEKFRMVANNPEYLVYWVGYREPTWEPIQHLLYSSKLLQEFNQKNCIPVDCEYYAKMAKNSCIYYNMKSDEYKNHSNQEDKQKLGTPKTTQKKIFKTERVNQSPCIIKGLVYCCYVEW